MPPRALLPTLLAGLLASACTAARPGTAVRLATEPPGALVFVNGASSGFVTPCMIELSHERPHRVELELDGYLPETRILVPEGYEQVILWHEMNIGLRNFRFPLWLNIDDFFVPVSSHAPLAPSRIFVRMKRLADE